MSTTRVVDHDHNDTRLEIHRARHSQLEPKVRPERLAYKEVPALPAATAQSSAFAIASGQAREAFRRMTDVHHTVLALLTDHLRTFLKAGDVINRRDGLDLTSGLVVSGHGARKGQLSFLLTQDPSVALPVGRSTVEAHWFARAFAIGADGKVGTIEYGVSSPMFPWPDPHDEVASGEPYMQFCDAFVDHWMRSTPETYVRLKPAAMTERA